MGAFNEATEADVETPEVEAPAAPKTVEEMLAELLQKQQEDRDTMTAMRAEIAAAKAGQGQPQFTSRQKSAEELLAERMDEMSKAKFYCPGCGRLSQYPKECQGRAEAPHPPMEMVSTDEILAGDPSKHTPAPATTNIG